MYLSLQFLVLLTTTTPAYLQKAVNYNRTNNAKFLLQNSEFGFGAVASKTSVQKTVDGCLSMCFFEAEYCFALNIAEIKANEYRCELYILNNDVNYVAIQSIGVNRSMQAQFYIRVEANCMAYRKNGASQNGVYEILAENDNSFQVWCDMTDEGGGWSVILRRVGGDVAFDRNWNEYKSGFGKLSSTHWIGNEHIHELTSMTTELKIQLIAFDNITYTVKYSNFKVFNESTNYQIRFPEVMASESNASNCFVRKNNNNVKEFKFSTFDRDNDNEVGSCSNNYGRGGWWFNACHAGYMTGVYLDDYPSGNTWCASDYGSSPIRIKYSVMKVRPVN